jgi:type I restriction enzyme S subunit
MIPGNMTGKWQTEKLGTACDINPSRKEIADLSGDTDVSFVPMAAISEDGKLVLERSRKLRNVRKGYTYFREADILFAKITPCMENGKRWFAKSLTNGIGFGSTEFHILRPKSQVIPEWIYYFISQQSFREAARRSMRGTAGQKRVPKRFLERVELPVPPLETQRRIVAVLRIAENLKQKRQKANEITSKLIQSVFLRMFGDPFRNPKGWPKKKLRDVCHKITDGTHVTPKYVDMGIPFLSVKDIRNGYLDFSDTKFISEEEHRALTKRSKPEFGDILYTKVGTVGIAAPVDIEKEFSIFVSVALIKPNHQSVNSNFLAAMLNSQFIRFQAHKRVKGIGVPDLHLVEIKDFDIVVPPMKMQKRFSRIVAQIQALKKRQQESTKGINQIFRALMYEAFMGELNYGDLKEQITSRTNMLTRKDSPTLDNFIDRTDEKR